MIISHIVAWTSTTDELSAAHQMHRHTKIEAVELDTDCWKAREVLELSFLPKHTMMPASLGTSVLPFLQVLLVGPWNGFNFFATYLPINSPTPTSSFTCQSNHSPTHIFSYSITLSHPFTCFSFISPFGYTIQSPNTFNPLSNSNLTSYNIPVLTFRFNIPSLYGAS